MHFRVAVGAILRTTAVHCPVTDVGLYGSEKKARGRQAIFCGTPRSARGRSAVAIAEFGTYDYKNYSRHKRGSPQRQCVRDSASWVAKEGADTEKCLIESRCGRFYRVFGYYRDMADSRNKGAAFERNCAILRFLAMQSSVKRTNPAVGSCQTGGSKPVRLQMTGCRR